MLFGSKPIESYPQKRGRGLCSEGARFAVRILNPKEKIAMKKHSSTSFATIIELRPDDPFFQQISETHERIARRAFDLFSARGFADGGELEDWLLAESEVLSPMRIELTHTDSKVKIRANLSEFPNDGIEVRVEPRRLVISGKREDRREHADGDQRCSETSSEILRLVELPVEIVAGKASAALYNGHLEVILPKAFLEQQRPVLELVA
jgi:HSP20 family molecular chaperone IbpA